MFFSLEPWRMAASFQIEWYYLNLFVLLFRIVENGGQYVFQNLMWILQTPFVGKQTMGKIKKIFSFLLYDCWNLLIKFTNFKRLFLLNCIPDLQRYPWNLLTLILNMEDTIVFSDLMLSIASNKQEMLIWPGYCHLCMDGHLKLRLQSL